MNPPSVYEQIQEAALFLRDHLPVPTLQAVVFGSGLSDEFISKLKVVKAFSYSQIPYFKSPTVEGHQGTFYIGFIQKTPLLVCAGRLHYYEGYSMEEVVFPVRVLARLGIQKIIMANAAGALNPRFKRGDLIFIKDHINLTGLNPLRGKHDERIGPRFVDMAEGYNLCLRSELKKTALKIGLKPKEGIYIGIAGPSYETPAEIRMFRMLGGDVIGMSTVPEIIAACHCFVKSALISCVTNELSSQKKISLTHDHVIEAAQKLRGNLARLLEEYFCNHP